ncbi:MAG: ETC complex I subunit [Rhodospirillaceae bacterium]|nr:ETC complex I subunit [Rhodospirillaceae bacterium]
MAKARIYQPAKTAMQSGRGNAAKWILDFEETEKRFTDPLVGWVGSDDTLTQVKLKFDSRDAAVAFAEKKGLDYTVEEPKTRRLVPKNYSDNFAYSKLS